MARTLENYAATETILICKNCQKEVPDDENCSLCGKPLVLIAKCNGGSVNE